MINRERHHVVKIRALPLVCKNRMNKSWKSVVIVVLKWLLLCSIFTCLSLRRSSLAFAHFDFNLIQDKEGYHVISQQRVGVLDLAVSG